LTEFLLIMAGAVAGLFLTVIFQEPLQLMLARVLGGIGPIRGTSIKGNWRSHYNYFSGKRLEITQVVQLRQFGPFVVGRSLGSSGSHRHVVRGRLRDGILTGVWHNVAENAHHHGAFQLILTPDGRGMAGKWVGFDRRHQVQHGAWKWEALPVDLTPREIEETIKPQEAMA
jgi:hypothetical protein